MPEFTFPVYIDELLRRYQDLVPAEVDFAVRAMMEAFAERDAAIEDYLDSELGTPDAVGTRLIESQTLAAAAGSVAFTVPAGYRHLELMWQARCVGAVVLDQLALRFNGDTGANYGTQRLFGAAAVAAADQNPTGTDDIGLGTIPGGSATAGRAGAGIARIFNYANTTWHKHVLVQWTDWDGTNAITATPGDLWGSLNAITSIEVRVAGGSNIAAGSIFDLYGRA